MVKFSGIATGNLIREEVTGLSFIYLRKAVYEYRRVKKERSELVTIGDKTETRTRVYYENDWDRISDDTQKADNPAVGKITLRLKEAEIMGRYEFDRTIYKPERAMNRPMLGDIKYDISGINAAEPIFTVGHLKDGYLGTGTVFVVSPYSEQKTIQELYDNESGFFSGVGDIISFFVLFIGLVILSHPAMYLVRKYSDLPVLKSLSRVGWVIFIILSAFIAFLIVKYASVLVELLWVIVAAMIIVPGVAIYRKIRSG